MRKGFTLVELSIVLVIIGLLIGGILVGQSLIDSAKINKEVRRLTQYSIAFINFRQKFKQEAGDSNYFSPSGNNDSDTEDMIGSCPSQISEPHSAWAHLSQAGMLTGESYAYPSLGVECPGGAHFIGVTPTTKVTETIHVSGFNPYQYFYYNSSSTSIGTNFDGKKYFRYITMVHPPEMLWGLENKLDDGTPSKNTGTFVRSESSSNGSPCTEAGLETDGGEPEWRFCNVTVFFSPTSAPEMPLTAN